MTQTPLISVVLPVYNAGPYLREAVQSMLDQLYNDFELIIINDGSTDESWQTLREYQDPRIRLYDQKNHGLVATLNRGINLSRGEYIARMDQDDHSEPERLEKQIGFLERHKDIGVLGTTAYIMNEQSEPIGVNPALLDDTELKLQMMYQTPFTHGSVMIRRDILLKLMPPFYRESAGNAEDYDFWSRLAPLTKLANIPESLYGWRNNPTGISNSGSQKQREFANQSMQINIHSSYFSKLLLDFIPNMGGYANESIVIHGKSVFCGRKDNYSYFLYRLSSVIWNKGFRRHSASFFLKALLGNPKYFWRALFD